MFAVINNKKMIWLFGGLAAFAAVLIAGTNIILKSVPAEEPAAKTSLPPLDRTREGDSYKKGTEYSITGSEIIDSRAVIYTDAGFAPPVTVIKTSDEIGCLITVENRSSRKIRVGVNPHRDAGDPGANYGELAPGTTGIYDVRYPGFSKISLHNHFSPAQGFAVVFGEGCR